MTNNYEDIDRELQGSKIQETDEENFKNPHAQANKRLVDDAYHSVLEWVLGKYFKWLWFFLISLCYVISNINLEKLGLNNFWIVFFADLSKSLLNIAFSLAILLILFPASSKLRESVIKLFQRWVEKRTQ